MNTKRLMIAHGIAVALCLSACLGLTACTTPPGDPPTSTSAARAAGDTVLETTQALAALASVSTAQAAVPASP